MKSFRKNVTISHITALVVIVMSLASTSSYALISKHYSLDRLVADADNIIIGTIDSIDSNFSSTGEIYSVINFKNASTIGPEGPRDIDGTYQLYILGGLMPNPEFGKGKERKRSPLSFPLLVAHPRSMTVTK